MDTNTNYMAQMLVVRKNGELSFDDVEMRLSKMAGLGFVPVEVYSLEQTKTPHDDWFNSGEAHYEKDEWYYRYTMDNAYAKNVKDANELLSLLDWDCSYVSRAVFYHKVDGSFVEKEWLILLYRIF